MPPFYSLRQLIFRGAHMCEEKRTIVPKRGGKPKADFFPTQALWVSSAWFGRCVTKTTPCTIDPSR